MGDDQPIEVAAPADGRDEGDPSFEGFFRCVKGQQDLPIDGQEICPLVATRIAHWWPGGCARHHV
jgi:hypothetical protein